MMISTKGRYALRVMVDLTENNTDAYIPLKDIAERQEISQKYLEAIMTVLSKAGYVDALHGKGGGYRLNRSPNEYTVASILKLTEGSLSPVSCLENESCKCGRTESCKTLPVWIELEHMINNYLEGITLGDLLQKTSTSDYVI